jgi:hypothetical protein
MTDEAIMESVTTGDINFGTRQLLREPLSTAFGEMREERRYLSGCTLTFAIDTSGEMLRAVLVDEDGTERVVDIGKTPEGFDPARERMTAQAAGNPGEYLMVTQIPGNNSSIRYLDRTDITGVAIEKGKPVTFKLNPERGNRQLTPPGTVISVTGFKVNPTPIV